MSLVRGSLATDRYSAHTIVHLDLPPSTLCLIDLCCQLDHHGQRDNNQQPDVCVCVCRCVCVCVWLGRSLLPCHLKSVGFALADSRGGAAGGARPPFEIPKRVFKRDPPKTFAPAALAVAAAPPPPFPQILDPPVGLYVPNEDQQM